MNFPSVSRLISRFYYDRDRIILGVVLAGVSLVIVVTIALTSLSAEYNAANQLDPRITRCLWANETPAMEPQNFTFSYRDELAPYNNDKGELSIGLRFAGSIEYQSGVDVFYLLLNPTSVYPSSYREGEQNLELNFDCASIEAIRTSKLSWSMKVNFNFLGEELDHYECQVERVRSLENGTILNADNLPCESANNVLATLKIQLMEPDWGILSGNLKLLGTEPSD